MNSQSGRHYTRRIIKNTEYFMWLKKKLMHITVVVKDEDTKQYDSNSCRLET